MMEFFRTVHFRSVAACLIRRTPMSFMWALWTFVDRKLSWTFVDRKLSSCSLDDVVAADVESSNKLITLLCTRVAAT